MKRLFVIAAAVLVPFGVLVAWALSALGEAPPPPLPVHEPLPVPVVVARTEPPPRPPEPEPLPAPVVEAAPPPAAEEPAPPPTDEAVIRAAVVEQLTPQVNTCFLDTAGPLKQTVRISATFETDQAGRLHEVRVKMKSADPYLVACVQDTLEGATLDPAKGLPKGTLRHTFSFNPNGAKEAK